MKTVVEVDGFRRAAHHAGLADVHVDMLVAELAADPARGVLMSGGAGVRKWRWAIPGSGKGKFGGVRVISFYVNEAEEVYLLDVFAKSQKANLTDRQLVAIASLVSELKSTE